MKGMKKVLRSGDRIKIRGTKPFSFVFQKVSSSIVGAFRPTLHQTMKPLEELNANSVAAGSSVSVDNAGMNDSGTVTQTKELEIVPPINASLVSSQVELQSAMDKEREVIRRQYYSAFLDMVLTPDEIDVSFSNLPYYVCPDTKQMLISRVFPFLHCPRYAKYIEMLKTNTRQILLTGPT